MQAGGAFPDTVPRSDVPCHSPGADDRAPTRRRAAAASTPKGDAVRLTRLVRDEARELLFRELPAGRPGTPFVVSPFPELSLGCEPHPFPAQVPCEAPTPAFTRASSTVRVNEPMVSARAESQAVSLPPKGSWRVTGRHVVTTSAAHVFDCQRRAPSVSCDYRFHLRPKSETPRWTARTHGRTAHFGGPNRLVAGLLDPYATRIRPSL